MTIPFHIAVGHYLDHSEKVMVETIINQTFEEIDRIYNKWNPHSELSAINQAEAFDTIPLSQELFQCLLQVDAMVGLSDKLFDPTIEPVQYLWKPYLDKGQIPPQKDLEKAFIHIGWDKFHFTRTEIWKEHAQCSLDLGGIAKGLAIDLIAQRLSEAGYQNLYVEWGGEIAAKGNHPDNRPWRVLVTQRGVPGDTDIVVDLKDMAVASSGDYLQNWTTDHGVYTHIFNPKTGSPLKISFQSISSVTIVAPSCLLADTIATTVMLFETREQAVEWLTKLQIQHPEISYWIYTARTST